MHISLPASTLLTILAVIVVLAIIFRLISMRYQGPRKAPRAPRTPRAPRAPGSPGRSTKKSRGLPYGTRDHGLAMARKYGIEGRSPEWPALAHAHLAKEPGCRVCGHTGQGLQVHHIKPFHLFPELELDPNNLITLCELKGRDHHLLIGHLDDWASYNPQVRTDVDKYHKENAPTIKANPAWQKEELNRPQPQRR